MTAKLDPVIHEPNRLQICALLIPLEGAEFRVIRDTLGLSDSALSKHIKHLEKEGYVEVRKNTVNARQRRWIGLTSGGRSAFSFHVQELKRLATLGSDTLLS